MEESLILVTWLRSWLTPTNNDTDRYDFTDITLFFCERVFPIKDTNDSIKS